jgi:hypothetical protein
VWRDQDDGTGRLANEAVRHASLNGSAKGARGSRRHDHETRLVRREIIEQRRSHVDAIQYVPRDSAADTRIESLNAPAKTAHDVGAHTVSGVDHSERGRPRRQRLDRRFEDTDDADRRVRELGKRGGDRQGAFVLV